MLGFILSFLLHYALFLGTNALFTGSINKIYSDWITPFFVNEGLEIFFINFIVEWIIDHLNV